MQNNNFDIINEIQENADIVAVISQYVKLTPKGSNYFGLCPFHPDTNPSMSVSRKKRIFKCFVCNTKGNVFTFVQKYKRISFFEAVIEVAKMTNYDISKLQKSNSNKMFDPKVLRLIGANKQANEWYQGFLRNPENKKALEYLNARNLNDEIISAFEIGYATGERTLIYEMMTNANNMFGTDRDPSLMWNEQELIDAGLVVINKDGKIQDFLNDRITFPIYDANNTLIGFSGRTLGNNDVKYLNTSTSKLFNKGGVLYNLNRIKDHEFEKLIVVEGFFDAIAYHNAGFPNVVATMGVAMTNAHIQLLKTIKNLKTIILSFDNDIAGKMALIENGKKLLQGGFNVYVVAPNQNNRKDVDEILLKDGASQVEKIVNERLDFVSHIIIDTLRNKKLALDEHQTKIKEMVKLIQQFGDSLLRNRHIKLLAELTGIDAQDIERQFGSYSNLQSYKPSLKKESAEQKVLTNLEVKLQDKQKRLNKELYSMKKCIDSLIMILICSPENVEKVFDTFTLQRSYGSETQLFIIKLISVISRKQRFGFDAIIEYLKERTANNPKDQRSENAHEYLIELIDDPAYFNWDSPEFVNTAHVRLNKLLQKIRELKYSVSQVEKEIKRIELCLEDSEINQVEIDRLTTEINQIKSLQKELK